MAETERRRRRVRHSAPDEADLAAPARPTGDEVSTATHGRSTEPASTATAVTSGVEDPVPEPATQGRAGHSTESAPRTGGRLAGDRLAGDRLAGDRLAGDRLAEGRAASGRPTSGGSQPAADPVGAADAPGAAVSGPDAGPSPTAERQPPGSATGAEDREVERGLRGLVGSGSSQVSLAAAMRARDAARPDDDEIAHAQATLTIIRRGWVPRDELPRAAR
jgi:hypothetical protein